jgi:integrase
VGVYLYCPGSGDFMKLRKRKLKDGSYSYYADLREGGMRKRHVFKGIKDRDVAEAALAELRLRRERGHADLPTQLDLRLEDCMEAYLLDRRMNCSASHVSSLENGAKLIIDCLGPNTLVRRIQTDHINRLKSFLLERGNSSPTINKRLNQLRAAVRLSLKQSKLGVNPISEIEHLSDDRGDSWRWLKEPEINQLLAVCRDGTAVRVKRKNGRDYEKKIAPVRGLYEFVVFLLNTGARKGEALALTWVDVDFDRSQVRILATKKAAKGRKAQSRHVPMNATARELLVEMKTRGNGPKIFDVDENNLRRSFVKACEYAGIGHVRLHDLRHTFASHLVSNGTSLEVIRVLLGHEKMDMTLRYAHLAKSVSAQAVESLNLGGADALASVVSMSELKA